MSLKSSTPPPSPHYSRSINLEPQPGLCAHLAASPALGQARAGAAGSPAEGQSYRESCTWQNHCK